MDLLTAAYFIRRVIPIIMMTKVNCIEPLSRVSRVLIKEGLISTGANQSDIPLGVLLLHTLLFVIIFFLLIMNGVNAVKASDNTTVIYLTCIFIPIANLSVKVITILLKKQYFTSLLNYLKSDVFNNHSEELNGYVKFMYRISDMIWRYYTFICSIYVSMVAALPLAIDMNLMIPPPFEMGKYLVAYKLFHAAICFYIALNSVCFDVLFMSLLGLCITQLHILEKRLMNVFEEIRDVSKGTSLEDMYLCEEKVLKCCISLHDNLSKYVDKLSIVLSLPIFVQYFCGCFVICNLVLQLTIMGERNTGNIFTIVVYAVIMFSQMATYHWLGKEIIFISGNIANACYLSNWYQLNNRSKKLLIILMERAKRPLVVHLYKLVFVSLESLGVVVRWSYSLFALIKARYS